MNTMATAATSASLSHQIQSTNSVQMTHDTLIQPQPIMGLNMQTSASSAQQNQLVNNLSMTMPHNMQAYHTFINPQVPTAVPNMMVPPATPQFYPVPQNNIPAFSSNLTAQFIPNSQFELPKGTIPDPITNVNPAMYLQTTDQKPPLAPIPTTTPTPMSSSPAVEGMLLKTESPIPPHLDYVPPFKKQKQNPADLSPVLSATSTPIAVPGSISTPVYVLEWSPSDNLLLSQAVEECGQNWIEVSKKIPKRTAEDCANHWLSIQPRKGKWSAEEDAKLISAYNSLLDQETVANGGFPPNTTQTLFWYKVAAYISGRSSTQCHARYSETLDPKLKYCNY
jgi:hypothetical protein